MSAKSRHWTAAALVGVAFAGAPAATADSPELRAGLEVVQKVAVGFGDDTADLLRIEIYPQLEARFQGGWRANIALRIEAAAGDVGLGTDTTYSDASRPLSVGPDGRVEIDEATLSWRQRSTRLTLGKQALAWGVLDGLQVTDRFDAVRRREAVFIDQRPDRISRWGARAEFEAAGLRWDIAGLIDGTADQLAQPGDSYSVGAPRLRAGLPPVAPLPDLAVETSSAPTIGVRVARSFGSSDASLLVIHGPDTEPVFRPTPTGVQLDYDTRTLIGATWQATAGARVWRVEGAFIADQPVNLEGPTLPTDDRQRWLAGVAVDWDLRDGVFLNAQIGADHVEGDGLVRPNTDVIATLKAQKRLANDAWTLSAELLGSLSDGDGTFRPAAAWQFSDTLALQAGLDLVWGDQGGLFGQFENTDRLWLKATWSI